MQGNYNNYTYPTSQLQPRISPMGPNAVNINIISPQAYAQNPVNQQGFYPVYGPNTNTNMPLYPQNYNNMIQPSNATNAVDNKKIIEKTEDNESKKNNESVSNDKQTKDEKTDKTKKITPLTDDYVKSLENYLNNDNPKVRLIGAKELMERLKEDDNRKDNPSLIPLVNKTLRDSSAAVRFLGLTSLQLGYCVGDDETVQILKEIQAGAADKFGEDSLLASEILLKLAAPNQFEIPDNSPDEPKMQDDKKEESKNEESITEASDIQQGSAL